MGKFILNPIRQRYGEYKFFEANRAISQSNLEAIADDIETTYLLDLYPIVTDAEKAIIDGQHRFLVAKNLMLPFYAIQSDMVTVEDIALANNNTLPYTIDDVRHVYANLGLSSYAHINQFVLENPNLSTGFCATLLDAGYSKQSFLDGYFSINRPEYAQVVASYIRDFAKVHRFVSRSVYTAALANLALNPLYEHSKMLKRLEHAPTKLFRCNSLSEAFEILTDLYNYQVRQENRVKLTYLPKSAILSRYDKLFVAKESERFSVERGIRSGPVVIQSSTEYSKFKLHPCRRPISPRSQTNLVQQIKRKNLLHCYPIICDNSLTIVDGQRRFLAAQELGLPIYYIESSSISLPMLVRASTRSKAWLMIDYLKHYCTLGIEPYLVMADFRNQYPFMDLQTAMRFLFDNRYDARVMDYRFRIGQLDLVGLAHAKRVACYIDQLKDPWLKKNRTFQFRFFAILRKGEIDPDIFVNQANRYPELMRDFVGFEDCERAIERTYNYRRANDGRLRYTELEPTLYEPAQG